MHRSFSIVVPPVHTAALCQELAAQEEVVSVALHRGASQKPPGDVLTVQVLNRGADEVLRRLRALVPEQDISVATSELTSLVIPAQEKLIVGDKDEAIWEEMESGLRYQSRLTPNYLYLMFLAGLICAVGLVSEPVPQAVAFTAAAVVAPGFDPIAKLPLGIILRRWPVIWYGLLSTVVGYTVLVAAAWATMLLLLWLGESSAAELARNPEVQSLMKPSAKALLVSGAGALAGVIMLAAFRRSFMAGPLIAQAIIPAAALIGAGLATSQNSLTWAAAQRFGLDWVGIVACGLLIFGLKQLFVHKRRTLL
ncbi:DUF389 domain-containing protein [Hymenobacter sp. BT635]|uniref:DUF389 domain-containing protein n=1 Tax=Hymenobacter nitidus TaxID=2880929 RepID=A0ABS8ACB3_9BACT|nr:DUF389 domain-containing protein [Hymenobacter nitidus]MCB2376880.1 DUF389 domain-containing protein [Hymenobacter nitidus]